MGEIGLTGAQRVDVEGLGHPCTLAPWERAASSAGLERYFTAARKRSIASASSVAALMLTT